MKQHIISFSGMKDSGKSTAVKGLIAEGWVELSFSKLLKDVISIVFGWDRAMLNGDTPEHRRWREKLDPFWTKRLHRPWSPRIAMQVVGTEAFREIVSPQIWVVALEKQLEGIRRVAIADTRFDEERDMLLSHGATFIQIKKKTAEPVEGREYHVSEIQHRNWVFDFVVDNDKTIPDLYRTIQQIKNGIMKK